MKVLVHDGLGIWLCARRLEQGKFHWAQVHQGETVPQPGTVTGTDPRFALAAHWTTAGGDDALNQAVPFCYSPNVLFHSSHDLRHTAVMNTLPDLSQLTHEQLLEFTRQLALQHQSLAQSNQQLDARVQHLEVTNQQLDSKVQHLSILTQNTSMSSHYLNSTNLAVKRTSHRKTNPSVG